MVAESRSARCRFAAAVLLFAVAFPRALSSQTTIVRFAGVDPGARSAVLEKLRRTPGSGGGRVFCVTRDTVRRVISPSLGPVAVIDSIFLVLDVERAAIDSVGAAGTSLLHCGVAVPWILDRASPACSSLAGCEAPASEACAPASTDYLALLETRAPYAAVRCHGDQFRFFFPAQFMDVTGSWSLERRSAPDRSFFQRRRMDSGTFTALLFAGVWANGAFGIDRDVGGYRDEWTLDKYTHGLAAGVLTFGAMTAGVPRDLAAVGVCAAGGAFEVSQGYVSNRDFIASCGGALVAWGWHRLWAK
jgi:hypothetical protein